MRRGGWMRWLCPDTLKRFGWSRSAGITYWWWTPSADIKQTQLNHLYQHLSHACHNTREIYLQTATFINKPFKQSMSKCWSTWIRQETENEITQNIKSQTYQDIIDWIEVTYKDLQQIPALIQKVFLVWYQQQIWWLRGPFDTQPHRERSLTAQRTIWYTTPQR